MSDEDWTPALQLMLDESRRSIDRQSEIVQRVRERAVGLVGFGSVVAAAFGLAAEDGPGGAGYAALSSFLIVVAVAVYVLIPREFRFELSADRIDDWIFKDPATRGNDHIVRSTARAHSENHAFNQSKLNRLHFAILVGVGGLAVESIALVARLVL